MDSLKDLLPVPSLVRERLARNYKEAARLRRLLRLSEDVAQDRHKQAHRAAQARQAEGGGR